MLEKINETVRFLQARNFHQAEVGIILGTGLSALAERIDEAKSIPYGNIPHFPLATVEFHKGKLILGDLSGKKVIAMQGRFHYYEGYSMEEVVFPVRVMHKLGIKHLLISNAAGSMNLQWKKGELMVIEDHLNLQPDNPLRSKDASAFGPIFTDMSRPYDASLLDKLTSIAAEKKINLRKGVYVAVAGPSLETRAEYRYLRMIGADVVGMSTVPEVIAANQLNIPVAAISVLTDECDPDNLQPIDIQDIIDTAKAAESNLVELYTQLLKEL